MKEAVADVNMRIAKCVGRLRARNFLSLDALAARSGVSRSMISLIERGESNATAVVLEKLAAGLGVTLASLFDTHGGGSSDEPSLLARRADQVAWQDPDSGYTRRNLTSPGLSCPVQLVEVNFPPGARVAFETGARSVPVHQQVWLIRGAMDITVGRERHRLKEGDCLAMELDQPTLFHNPTRKSARYVVVIASRQPATR